MPNRLNPFAWLFNSNKGKKRLTRRTKEIQGYFQKINQDYKPNCLGFFCFFLFLKRSYFCCLRSKPIKRDLLAYLIRATLH
ncbi:hypothetical protein A7Q10_07795 [Methylacidiphilum caldifontis]|uniref:Uncharacterized protein n=1 Tax=Methylacidiphilum caldifontis TaxID=2795386 RepID=A0A4Y8PC32_9BACT|nr:hypothetical protein A7Q10_07795 [Methylacidiphilum caldifontis]